MVIALIVGNHTMTMMNPTLLRISDIQYVIMKGRVILPGVTTMTGMNYMLVKSVKQFFILKTDIINNTMDTKETQKETETPNYVTDEKYVGQNTADVFKPIFRGVIEMIYYIVFYYICLQLADFEYVLGEKLVYVEIGVRILITIYICKFFIQQSDNVKKKLNLI
jgi:hypothetical protein